MPLLWIFQEGFRLQILFFSLTAMLFNNWAEFAIIGERLAVFYKQVLHSLPILIAYRTATSEEDKKENAFFYSVIELSPPGFNSLLYPVPA